MSTFQLTFIVRIFLRKAKEHTLVLIQCLKMQGAREQGECGPALSEV